MSSGTGGERWPPEQLPAARAPIRPPPPPRCGINRQFPSPCSCINNFATPKKILRTNKTNTSPSTHAIHNCNMAVTLRSGHATGRKSSRDGHRGGVAKHASGSPRRTARSSPPAAQLPLPKPEEDDDEHLEAPQKPQLSDHALARNPDYIALTLARRLLTNSRRQVHQQLITLLEMSARVNSATTKRELIDVYMLLINLSQLRARPLVLLAPQVQWSLYSAELAPMEHVWPAGDDCVRTKQLQMFKK